jgi:hypothetical protein
LRRNFDLSTGLVGIGAVAVLISLFLDWYEPGLTAWHAFELADWLLAALAVGALVVIATEAASGDGSQRLAWICGIVAFVVLAQIIDPPPAASGNARAVGAWVALAGSAAMVAGAVLALAEISVSIDVAERRRRTAAVDARDGEGGGGGAGSGPAADGGSGVVDTSGLWGRPASVQAEVGGGAGGTGGGAVGGGGASASGSAPRGAGASGAAAGAARGAEPTSAPKARTAIVPEAPEVDEDRTQEFRTTDHPDDDPA